MGGTYTADSFRAFLPANGVQYFSSDEEYLEYKAEHADKDDV